MTTVRDWMVAVWALLILLIACLGGCASGQVLPNPTVWVDPAIPADEVWQALQAWQAVGIEGRMVQTEQEANLKFRPEPSFTCSPDEEQGRYTTWQDGTIWIRTSCWPDITQMHGLIAVLAAHELGHAFGIREHVPFDYQTGQGTAIMNAIITLDAPILTDLDVQAFDRAWTSAP